MMPSIAAVLFAVLGCVSPADVPVSPVHYVPTCGHVRARVAANDRGALGVWSSSHVGFGNVIYWMSGALLDADGAPARPAEHIYQYGGSSAELATDGRDYLMVLPTTIGASAQVIASTGESAGDAVPVISNLTAALAVRAVWNGEAYTVVASDATRTTIALVASDGKLLESADVAGGATIAALSPAGRGSVLALLRDQSGVKSVLLKGVTAAAPEPLPIATTAVELALASDGSRFLAVSRDSGRITAFPLDANGRPAGTPSAIAFNASGDGLAVVSERNASLVFWTGNGVEAARVGADGVASPPFSVMPGVLASAASNGERTIVLARSGCASIASSVVSPGAQFATAPRDVSLAAVPQSTPQIVATAAGHQLFWNEASALLTAFAASDGSIGPPKHISASIGRSVALAAGGGTLVIWSDFPGGQLPGTLRVARFDAYGNEVNERVIADAFFFFGLAAAWNGSDVVVAWSQENEPAAKFEVHAARLSTTGDVLVEPKLLSIPSDDMYDVVVGAEGDRALIGWRNRANTIVAVETNARLDVVNRREMLMPHPVVFPIAAAIHDEAQLIAWWAADDASSIRLRVTDFITGATATLDRNFNAIGGARLLPRGDAWDVYVSELAYPVSVVWRATLRGMTFGKAEVVQCAPGTIAVAVRGGDRIDAVLYSAPEPDLEGASRLRLRKVVPPRRRAAG